MILICDNCYHIFDSDSLEKFPVSREKNFPECCPFCGATSVTYTLSDGRVHAKKAFPALRHTTPSERNIYEKTVLKAHESIQHDNIVNKARARIEEALAIINSSGDELFDDEYNMLLIFAFLCGRSSNVLSYLTPILGLDRFRPGSQGRPADPQYDTERVYENVTKMFKSFVTSQNPAPDSLGSDANYVASFMRSGDNVPVRKTMKGIVRAIIDNISIEALCASPGKVYLDIISKIVNLYEKRQA